MPFNSQVNAMFAEFKVQYIQSGGSEQKYQEFYDALNGNAWVSARYNDAQGAGFLKKIVFATAPSSHYISTEGFGFDPRSNHVSISLNSAGGAITFEKVAVEGNAVGADGNRDLTGTFIAAHEVAHAIETDAQQQAFRDVVNSSLNYVTMHKKDASVDITSQVKSIVDVMMAEEARATFSAYNDMISSIAGSGRQVTTDDLEKFYNSTSYAQYIIDPGTMQIRSGVPINSSTGLISLLPADLSQGVAMMRHRTGRN